MNWLSLLGLEGLAARWRANLIEGAIAAEDRMDLARLEWADLKQRLQQLLVLTILVCLLYTSPSPRDQRGSRMPSSA